tara:strand:- start:1572 stop:2147 length:576 start_codon:yes stop_codon:yes gene_type:complete
MPLEQRQINLLKSYKDKSYVMGVLCEKSFEYFNFIKSICNIPLILISSIMAILNSSTFDGNEMKIPNIVINSLTAMIVGMINNFSINEKENNFKQLSSKFMKISHSIEDKLHNHLETLTSSDVSNQIKEYDNLIEQIDFTFPTSIQKTVKKLYKNKKQLPAILNGDTDDIIIDTISTSRAIPQMTSIITSP